MMGLDVWFREDVARILAAIAIARDGLTSDERTILAAICAGFGVSLAEVLTMDGSAVPLERQAIMQLPAKDLDRLVDWLEDYCAQRWDQQIQKDLEAGRLDALLAEVDKKDEAGLSQPL